MTRPLLQAWPGGERLVSAQLNSDFLREIVARGFMHQCTDLAELDALATRKVITAYIGFDATADSLHVGSLVQIMLLRLLQRTGHRRSCSWAAAPPRSAIPSFRDESRKLLNEEQIARNIAGIRTIFSRFLAFGNGPTDAVMANNADWLDRLEYIPFLRDYGSHFSVNRMLSFDSVKLRLEREQSLSFLEFNYMILQAYGLPGAGAPPRLRAAARRVRSMGQHRQRVELGRRIDNRALFGLTSPLIATASGAKMGKTAAGAVLASTPTASAPTTTGSISATPTMATSAASCACSPTCRSRRSRGWRRARRRDQRRQGRAGERDHHARPRRRGRRPPRRDRTPHLRRGQHRRRPADARPAGVELERGIPAFQLFHAQRPRRQQRRARRLIKGAAPGSTARPSPTRRAW